MLIEGHRKRINIKMSRKRPGNQRYYRNVGKNPLSELKLFLNGRKE